VNEEASVMTRQSENERASREAYAYTPGLKVKRSMIVQKFRRLPIRGEVLVKEGDEVAFHTEVARTLIPGDPYAVKAALLLGVEPDELPDFIVKKVGEHVNEGEPVAQYNVLFGLFKRFVNSPVDGTIENISNLTGQIIIRSSPTPLTIPAYIPGRVVKVVPGEGVVIENRCTFVQGIFGLGGESHGEINILVDSPDRPLTVDMISKEDKGKLVIGGSYITLDAIKKAIQVGAAGIVCGGIDFEVVTKIRGEQIGVAITGEEELGLTLIITEGFGTMTMSQRTFDLFKDFEGYQASINGATQIRAGVIRPEIIIPHKESFRARKKSIKQRESEDELTTGMAPGTLIRVIREPYFGAIGVVKRLPVELQKVETESLVRVLVVDLEDGRTVVIPRANVEIIEE